MGLELHTLLNDLCSLKHKWYIFGIQLKIDTEKLRSIEKEHPDYHERCLADTLEIWLSGKAAVSWETIVEALRTPSVDEKELAAKLQSKYAHDQQGSSQPSVETDGPEDVPPPAKRTPSSKRATTTEATPTQENPVEATTEQKSPVQNKKLKEKPKISELILLRGNGVEVEIITTVAADWRDLGIEMDFDDTGDQLDQFESDETLSCPEDCCQKMFQHWLAGNGEPCTWEKLIEMLDDAKKGQLAEKIKTVLECIHDQQGSSQPSVVTDGPEDEDVPPPATTTQENPTQTTPVEATPVQKSPVQSKKLKEKPSLTELTKLKGNGIEVMIISTIAADWKNLGLEMDFDETGDLVDQFESDETLVCPEDCCQKVFQHWLAGNGVECTWEKLIELLGDVKKGKLAEEIKTVLEA